MALNSFAPNTKIESEKINENFDGLADGSEMNVSAGNEVNLGGAWQSFSPSWFDFTVGNGTEQHYYTQIGKTVFVRGRFSAGSTSTTTLSFGFDLPVTANANVWVNTPIGNITYEQDSSNNLYTGIMHIADSTRCIFRINYVSSQVYTRLLSADMDTSARPFDMATGDILTWQFMYEAS